jgi:polyisoprenoid-binding protein YceI
MRTRPGRLPLAPLLAVLLAGPIHAHEWVLDTKASSAAFEVPVLRWFSAHGRFADLSGTLSWDPASRELRVAARIPTATLQMTSDSQARWAKSKDFFDVERYPEITFESEPVALTALREGMTLKGTLTLHGRSNTVELLLAESHCELAQAEPCTLRAGTRVARADFALPRYRAIVGDEVVLRLDVLARPLSPP